MMLSLKSTFIRFLFLAIFSLAGYCLPAQAELLQSGPMLGYNEMREILLWVQTNTAAKVQFAYWVADQPDKKFFTDPQHTLREEAFTAKLIADQVMPGARYAYELQINDQKISLPYSTYFTPQPNWKAEGQAPDFRIALGSCTNTIDTLFENPDPAFTRRYQIFPSIVEQDPDLMLWLGDNIYLGDPDWYTWTGILHRYTQTRSMPEMQELLASTYNYAIWDDHDFGPNNSDRSFIHKDKTLAAFELFWGNPSFGLPETPGAISFFQYMDIDFFLLDNRYHRSPNDRRSGEKTILGKAQLEWLIDALSYSQAPFKMVAIGGQVLNTAPLFENYANHHFEERQYLLRRIEEEGITGVVFLTGDRHHTELSRYVNNRGIAVYDLTISPLTSRSYDAVDEPNQLRVPGTHVGIQNFGILEVSGPKDDRRIQIEVRDTQGKLLWEYEIE